MASSVALLDYGSGNIRSAHKALERVGAQVEVTADPADALAQDALVVPGVGAFAACVSGLAAVDGTRIISEFLDSERPVLGICVGMQIMFERGVEHGEDSQGCGFLPGVVEALDAPVVPHMGWNTVRVAPESRLFAGIEHERFYFVHSYGVKIDQSNQRQSGVTSATYGDVFVAAVESGTLAATQFHPEKSGDAGLQLLTNWVAAI